MKTSLKLVTPVLPDLDDDVPVRVPALKVVPKEPKAYSRKLGHVFQVSAVYGRDGLSCDPAYEMLTVAHVKKNGQAVPVDCVSLRDLGTKNVKKGRSLLAAAYDKAQAQLKTVFRHESKTHPLPGWDLMSEDGDRLDFVAEHFGRDEFDRVVRNRVREIAHDELGLNLGPSHASFMLQNAATRPWSVNQGP